MPVRAAAVRVGFNRRLLLRTVYLRSVAKQKTKKGRMAAQQQFMEITGSDATTATHFLEAFGGSLDVSYTRSSHHVSQ